jgi:hypothetical protein
MSGLGWSGKSGCRQKSRQTVGIRLARVVSIANPDNNPDKLSGFAPLSGLPRIFRQIYRQNGGIGCLSRLVPHIRTGNRTLCPDSKNERAMSFFADNEHEKRKQTNDAG